MPTAQASRDNHNTLVCSKCLEPKTKDELESIGREYVCGDCR